LSQRHDTHPRSAPDNPIGPGFQRHLPASQIDPNTSHAARFSGVDNRARARDADNRTVGGRLIIAHDQLQMLGFCYASAALCWEIAQKIPRLLRESWRARQPAERKPRRVQWS
jgi:hypothetical protein